MPEHNLFDSLIMERREAEQTHLVQIRNDVYWFCSALQELTITLQNWLNGQGFSIAHFAHHHTDKSICLWPGSAPLVYEARNMSLEKKGMHVVLRPVSVYGGDDSRGNAEICILNMPPVYPDIRCQSVKISLSRKTSCWFIRSKEKELCFSEMSIPLTQQRMLELLST